MCNCNVGRFLEQKGAILGWLPFLSLPVTRLSVIQTKVAQMTLPCPLPC